MNMVKKMIKVKSVETSTLERHPVPVLGIDYRVKIAYKNIKVAEVDVEKATIIISLPNKYKKGNNKAILDLAIDKMYEQIAKVEIERAMEKTRIMLGFAPEDYEIKKMTRVFGKCENRKITINPEVVKFDRDTIDYVVLHQYCHLKYKTHAPSFFKLVRKYEPDYGTYESKLLESL